MRTQRYGPLPPAVRRLALHRRDLLKGGFGLMAGAVLGGLPDTGDTLVARAPEAVDPVADPAPVEPEPEAAPEAEVEATPTAYRRGDAGEGVLALQAALAGAGFWCGAHDGGYGHLTEQAVMAVQKTHGLARDAVAGPQTQAALATGLRPALLGGGGDRLEIQLGSQLAIFVRGGTPTLVLNTATGNNEPYDYEGTTYTAVTPPGDFAVYSRHTDGWQKGPLGDLYRPMYFHGGIAIHGSASIPAFPASHGCARVSTAAMDMIWSQGLLAMGSRVVVV